MSRLVGAFYQRSDQNPQPGLIILGGSDGGLMSSEIFAALLASHGYATLALAYFAAEGLPSELLNIPLEYFEEALSWMKAQDTVISDKLGVLGLSRGGELALLLGSTFQEIKAVVGYSPSGVIWRGLGREHNVILPAWTHFGNPLPFVPNRATPAQRKEIFDQVPVRSTAKFLIDLEDQKAVEKATIPVEKINGPVLLISGQDDQMWPSSQLSEIAIQRLIKHNHPYRYEHLSYPNAGHAIGIPNLSTVLKTILPPIDGRIYALGGNPESNAFAASDSWCKLLMFLDTSLKQ